MAGVHYPRTWGGLDERRRRAAMASNAFLMYHGGDNAALFGSPGAIDPALRLSLLRDAKAATRRRRAHRRHAQLHELLFLAQSDRAYVLKSSPDNLPEEDRKMYLLYRNFINAMKGQGTSAPLDEASIVLLDKLQDRLEGVAGGERDRRWWSSLAMIRSYHEENGSLPKNTIRSAPHLQDPKSDRLAKWIVDARRRNNFTPGNERAKALAALGIVPYG